MIANKCFKRWLLRFHCLTISAPFNWPENCKNSMNIKYDKIHCTEDSYEVLSELNLNLYF